MSNSATKKIAILVDLFGSDPDALKSAIKTISAEGEIVVARAYGDMSLQTQDQWTALLSELNIEFHRSPPAAPRAAWNTIIHDLSALKRSKHHVIGAGNFETNEAFRTACDVFISLEY